MRGGARPSGDNFEYRVRDALRKEGWEAERTMKSAQAGRHDTCDVHAKHGPIQLDIEAKYSKERSRRKTIRIELEHVKEAEREARGGAPVLAVNSQIGPLFIMRARSLTQIAQQAQQAQQAEQGRVKRDEEKTKKEGSG